VTPTRLLLLGSGEFMPWAADAERFVLSSATGDGSVAVLATASAKEGNTVFERWERQGLAHFSSIGIRAQALSVRRREDALDPEVARRLADVSMIFFSGGKPGYLAQVLRASPLWEAIEALLARGGVFAGCSAGAVIAGAISGAGGNPRLPLMFRSGLGLAPATVFGVHWDAFDKRGLRWLREILVWRMPKSVRLIGVAEETAIAVDDLGWRVFGRGAVDVRYGAVKTFYRAPDIIPL
jgi:cyanophycinase